MSWICDYCSTANDDRSKQCFVCGKERSKESIREANRAKITQTLQRICKITIKAGKISFFSSVALFSILFLITFVIKVRVGSIGDFLKVGSSLLGIAALNIKELFGDNLIYLFQQSVWPNFVILGKNFAEGLFETAILDNLGYIPIVAVFEKFKGNLWTLFGNLVSSVSKIGVTLMAFWQIICSSIAFFKEKLFGVLGNFDEMVQNIKNKF